MINSILFQHQFNRSIVPLICVTARLSLKIVFILIGIVLCLSVDVKGQDALRSTLDYMFAEVNSEMIPTGCLIDYAIELENLDKFNGLNSSKPEVCDVVTYSHVLQTLFSSSFKTDHFQKFKRNLKIADEKLIEGQECRLSIVFNNYAQLKSDCLDNGAITYENGQVRIKRKDAFQIKKLCAACIIDNVKESNSIKFYVPENLVLSDSPISNIEIDWGDGLYSIISNSVTATLSDGNHIINVVITDSNGKKYYTSSCVDILSAQNWKHTRSIYYDSDFNTEEISGSSYNGIITKADVTVKLSSSNYSGKIKKPLIFVEGFDPRDFNPSLMGSMNYVDTYRQWSDFIESNGFDYIYVDWQEAGEYIQANAYTLISVINKINSIKDADSEPAILIGHSMGGLIARYALKTMENNGTPHNIGTYVSYDSPHMGANVPIGLLYGFHGLLKFLDDKNIIDSLLEKYTEVGALIEIGKRYAYSTATQQMLVDYIDPTGNPNNSVHEQWQKEIDNLGFPNGDSGKDFKKLAIANSDYSALDIDDKYIYCDFSAGVNIPHALSPLLSIAVGVLFQDVIAGLLTVLPGRDEINGVFECLSGKTNGQKVTNINIGYQKDFLWLIPISKTVFSYSKYHSGSCLYDIYPASCYSFNGSSSVTEDGLPIIFNWSADIAVTPKFAFIPTASALAVGNGLNNSASIYTLKPVLSDLIFDGIRMEAQEDFQTHTSISTTSKDWLLKQIQTTVDGPQHGYNGAVYSLSNQIGSVAWESSDTSLATISSQGVLTVYGNGVVKLTASVNGISYSKNIIVGMPKFVLESSHVPGGYQIDANIISSEFKNYDSYVNQIITFKWGIKYTGQDIKWSENHSSSILIPLENGSAEVTVFLRLVDGNGNIISTQSVNAQSTDIFSVTNNILSIDSNGNIYKESGSMYSYKNGKIYLTRDTSLESDYQRDIWTSTKGKVYSPFATTYDFTVTRGEIPIKQAIPEDEVNFILQNAEINQEYVYTLALLNPENKIIQFVPLTIKKI